MGKAWDRIHAQRCAPTGGGSSRARLSTISGCRIESLLVHKKHKRTQKTSCALCDLLCAFCDLQLRQSDGSSKKNLPTNFTSDLQRLASRDRATEETKHR